MNGPAVARAPLPPRLDARWLRALTIRGYTNAEIREQLQADALPLVGDADLDAIRARYPPPPNFQATSRSHTQSFRFLCESGVEAFFRRDPRDADAALAVLRGARARELVEAALVLGVPDDAIVKMVFSLLSFTTSTQTLQLYAATFFDTSVVSRAQLRVLVHERVKVSVLHAAGSDHDQAAVRRAVAGDPRMLALSLPRTPGAWHTVMLSLGWMPPRRELGAAIGELEQLATLRAGQALMRGGRDDERRADAYTNVLAKLRAIEQGVANPNDSALRSLQELRVVQATTRMPFVNELVARGDQVGTLELGPATATENNEENHAKPER